MSKRTRGQKQLATVQGCMSWVQTGLQTPPRVTLHLSLGSRASLPQSPNGLCLPPE